MNKKEIFRTTAGIATTFLLVALGAPAAAAAFGGIVIYIGFDKV